MVHEDRDVVVIKPHLVGTTHSDTFDAHEDRMNDRNFRLGTRSINACSTYNRYHRPMLQLYRKRNVNVNQFGSHIAGDFTFILPLAQPDHLSSRLELNPQMFCGRLVATKVHLPLIESWFRICQMQHIKSTTLTTSGRQVSQSGEDCIPKPRRAIQHFRLIDVRKQCVASAEDQAEYAALSYVWGASKRLLLTSKNMKQLSTPGALSPGNEEVPLTFKDAIIVAGLLKIDYLWIDALCVLQDNEGQLIEHMNIMDSIYGSSVLTIVSDTDSADNGIPGVSIPRNPSPVTFKYGAAAYVSAKRTFGKAMSDSPWESRAWCLQEKVFSKRLLIFTHSQAFYHCTSTTWFEDTIMEIETHKSGLVSIAERRSRLYKNRRPRQHTAYEAQQKLSGNRFWNLLEIFSRRQLSFESDAIRAFSGILKSVESELGRAHWGVPEYCFARGITWSLTRHRIENRRSQFPSWSWAGWRGNAGSDIHFGDLTADESETWNIEWHFHKFNESTQNYELTRAWQASNRLSKTEQQLDGIWALPGHPGEVDFVNRQIPEFEHDPNTMPPVSHVIRFFTSCARVVVDAKPDLKHHDYPRSFNQGKNYYYRIRSLSTKIPIGYVQLDPGWKGRGREQELVFVSASLFSRTLELPLGSDPSSLWMILVESFQGASELKRRVQMCEPVDISTWRNAEPVWKCVTLA